jgi:hypothetical protein
LLNRLAARKKGVDYLVDALFALDMLTIMLMVLNAWHRA